MAGFRRLTATAPAVVALLLLWLLHVAEPRAPFAPFSLGERIIRSIPGGLATESIEILGHAARPLLAATVIGLWIGLAISFRRASPVVVGLAFGASAEVAAALDPSHPDVLWSMGSAALAGLGASATAYLLASRSHPHALPSPTPLGGRTGLGRRRFLVGLGLGAGALLLLGTAARRSLQFLGLDPVRADRAAAVPEDAGFAPVPGLSSPVTPRATHYVVDVNLDPPIVDESRWRLLIAGAVRRPLSLSLPDLRSMPTLEQLSTLSCISNQVGGSLVGNSLWTGVPLADLLTMAEVTATAVSLRAEGADGYYDTIPMGDALRPDVLVAFGMNGATLPIGHGFPIRLLVPGIYGMKNVKWLTELRCFGHAEDGYWEVRGWDRAATVRTESRFDVPGNQTEVSRTFTAAGVAWAGDRRISRVEVSTDDGRTWGAARLEQELGALSWRRWRVDLQLQASGPQPLVVRAYDGAGRVQDAERRPPHPDGASGYHRIVVTVRP